MTDNPLIQYRGYHAGPKDTGGMTALYPTEAEALRRARACCFRDETAWVNPEFTGTLDTTLRALRPITYTVWKPLMARMTIPAGETFIVGDVLVAAHQTTRNTVARWLIDGTAELA